MAKNEDARFGGEIQPLFPGELANLIGERANRAAAASRFLDYRSRRADQTLRRQDADLLLFREFLAEVNVITGDLSHEPAAWRLVTWGLVEAFVKWQISKGYAIQSVNVHLSSIKTYARLAMQAGALLPQEYALIRAVQGYSYREQSRIDSRRKITRIGLKKSEPVKITPEEAALLKQQPDTPQGRRDTFMICLLLDHGLRVGEVAALEVKDFNLREEQLRFFRPKVNKEQIHHLTKDTLKALKAYLDHADMPNNGLALRRSLRNEELGASGMTERAITARVGFLGEKIGVMGLSAHDCRHFWATSAARHGTDPFVLQEAGGWSSLAMPRRYVDDNVVSNEGVKLD
ncbi:MAG: tyrosine-type recombinase/integrase [Anaerolineaceae bacterium]|nr:tyrosine-type recombinase/integrase [Anaerolineaceae bacterium]